MINIGTKVTLADRHNHTPNKIGIVYACKF